MSSLLKSIFALNLPCFFGNIFGLLMSYFYPNLSEIRVFFLHNSIFFISCGILLFLSNDVKFYGVAIFLVELIGFTYSWNAGVSRGFMAKLAVEEKRAMFMAFYSSVTYSSLASLSLFYHLLSFFIGFSALPFLVCMYSIVAYLFIYLLYRYYLKK